MEKRGYIVWEKEMDMETFEYLSKLKRQHDRTLMEIFGDYYNYLYQHWKSTDSRLALMNYVPFKWNESDGSYVA